MQILTCRNTVQSKVGKRLIWICPFFIGVLFSLQSIAQESNLDFESVNGLMNLDHDASKRVISWLPGEQYDTFTGNLNYSVTDLSLPGNGKLPIEIKRTFRQLSLFPQPTENGITRSSANRDFGRMDLGIPTATTAALSRGYSGCHGRKKFSFSDGEKQIDFYPVDDSNRHLATSPAINRNTAHYISVDNWILHCQDSTTSPPSIGNSRFKVVSPDGIMYEMVHVPLNPEANLLRYEREGVVYRVHRVVDPYGIALTYNYLRYSYQYNNAVKLDSIVADDGRRVEFEYELRAYRNPPTHPFVYTANWLITSIREVGGSKPQTITYDYSRDAGEDILTVTKNDSASTTYEFGGLTLNKVTTPYGGSVSYRYSDTDFFDIKAVMGGDANGGYYRYAVLRERISAGSTFLFEEHWSNSDTVSRLIRTDIGATEYRYTKSIQDAFRTTALIDDTDVDLAKDGRLMSYKVFDNRNIPWSTNAQDSLLQQKTYTYKSLYRISDRVRTSAQRIVPDRIVSTYYSNDGYGSGESAFTTAYESYDERGYPTRVTQSAADQEIESTSIDYRHGEGMAGWFIGKPYAVDSTDDRQQFYYNQFGDVKSASVNGVYTQYDWHTDGSSDRGELHTVTTQPDKTTTYRNYKRGQAGYISTPEGRVQFRTIDDNGLLVSETRFQKSADSSAPRRRYEYDSLHRLSKVDPSRVKSTSETLVWQSNNLLIATDLGFRRYMRIRTLDGFGRTLAEGRYDKEQDRWSTVRYAYDAEGRLVYTSYPLNQNPSIKLTYSPFILQKSPGTHHQYDALGRIVRTRVSGVEGNDSVQTYSYGADSSGNQTIAQTDARGHTSTITYKSYGDLHYKWPIKIVQPDNTETTVTRHIGSGRVKTFERAGEVTTYRYDFNKEILSIDSDKEGLRTFTYYDDAQVKSETHRDRVVEYEYYRDNRLRKESFKVSSSIYPKPPEDVTREYRYDSHGNLSELITTSESGIQNNTIFFGYDDDSDKVRSQTLLVDARQYRLEYDYDELSNLSQVIFPNKKIYNVDPDSFGNPQSIKQQGGNAKIIYDLIEYHPNNAMSLMRRSGHEVTNDLDASQRPGKFRAKQNRSGATAALAEKIYSYDSAVNVSKINDTVNSRVNVFEYDSRNRLISKTSTTEPTWTFGYLPDDNMDWMKHGDRFTDFSYAPNSKQLWRAQTDGVDRRYSYDLVGNISRHDRMTGTSSRTTQMLTYNAANQLIGIDDGTAYSYDARGLRVKADKYGPIYTIYGPDEKLIFRDDVEMGVTSEYFYVNEKLVARRDEDTRGAESPEPEDEDTNVDATTNGVTVSGRTISWPDDGWYQVQVRDSNESICEGGSNCTVPSAGDYRVINHSKDIKTYVSID